ncbi:hypothetical protein [Marinitoga aeolica]|uniref:ABC-2 type transport system permease protein n=1 Tax=Marinitoga aeolica TaxID=2809031 RepID=A0ABY8PNE5_9BACT|nr:hypothetical protein [Marinitoga aeolica]WGS64138.1 hypothetical protein JRV97_07075 [Marinitoga aeolica]
MKSKIWLILKYSYQNKVRPKKRKDGTYKKSNPFSALAAYLIPAVVFGISITPFMYLMFKDLNIPLSQLGIDLPWTILDIVFSMWFLIMGFMFFLNYSPAIVANLYESDMTKILLAMPLKRSDIYLSSAVDSLIMAGLPLGMMIPIFFVYGIIAKTNMLLATISGIGYILFLLLISNLGGVLFSKFLTKTSAKRMTMIMYFISIFIYVGITNIIPRIMENNSINQITESLTKLSTLLLNYAWPHTWIILIMKGNIIALTILLVTIIILGYIVYNISNSLELSVSRKKGKKKNNEINFKTTKFPTIKKDFKLLFRDSQTFFLILYPIFLPLIFIFTNSDANIMSLVFIMIATIYSAMLAIYSIAYEGKIWPMPKLLPITMGNMIFSKIIVPILIFSAEYIGISFLAFFLGKATWVIFVTIIPVIILIVYASILGVSIYLKNPKRDLSQKNIIKGKEVMSLEGIVMGFSFGIFLPGNLYMLSINNVQMKNKFIDFLFDSSILYHLVGGVLPISLLVLAIYLTIKEINKVKERMLKWE